MSPVLVTVTGIYSLDTFAALSAVEANRSATPSSASSVFKEASVNMPFDLNVKVV